MKSKNFNFKGGTLLEFEKSLEIIFEKIDEIENKLEKLK